MEKTNLKQKAIDNKAKLLELHKNFYENIDKVQSFKDSSRKFIENMDNFVGDNNEIKFKEVMMFFLMEKMTSSVNGFMGFGLNK